MPLVTLRQAKQHLRLPLDVTSDDADLTLKLAQAEALVLDYVTQNREDNDAWTVIVDAWTSETVPVQIVAAILIQFAELYRFRGDDEQAPETPYGLLNTRVTALLHRLRDPALS